MERTTKSGRDVALTARFSDVHQGLFPGIVGLPRQGDLGPNDGRFDIRLPSQHASRAQTTLRWSEAGDASAGWEYKSFRLVESKARVCASACPWMGSFAGFGFELGTQEWTTFGEARHRGPHGALACKLKAST